MPTDDRFAVPSNLRTLTELYAGKTQGAVRFRLPSWSAALDGVPGNPTRLLVDPAITKATTIERFRKAGDRVVTRDAVVDACVSIDLGDDAAVIAAFVLVMAWGSGTSNSRSLRNTRIALHDVPEAATKLRDAAVALRRIRHLDDSALLGVHRGFSLGGVGEAFFTKWFAFAGYVPERTWQPLILDSRVRATLHSTLDVWLNSLSEKHNVLERYVAYLTAMHTWSVELAQPMTATQLEWILFTHNGRPT